MTRHFLLVGTRKGAWTLTGDAQRRHWQISGPQHLGAVISHYVADPRRPGRLRMAVDEHGNIRRHIAMFVGETMVRRLDAPVPAGGRVQIVGALSGG
jgi:hypothetical protein